MKGCVLLGTFYIKPSQQQKKEVATTAPGRIGAKPCGVWNFLH